MNWHNEVFRKMKSETQLIRGIAFHNAEERAIGRLLAKYLELQSIEGVTYQRPIDSIRRLDFYLPEQNIVLEWHRVVLKWYMQERNYKQLKNALKGIPKPKQEIIKTVLEDEIKHNYTKKRRFLMDRSHDETVQKAKLIVAVDLKEFYDLIIKPYTLKEVHISQIIKEFNLFKKHGRRLKDLKK